MYKKIISAIMALAMAAVFAGCGNEPVDDESSKDKDKPSFSNKSESIEIKPADEEEEQDETKAPVKDEPEEDEPEESTEITEENDDEPEAPEPEKPAATKPAEKPAETKPAEKPADEYELLEKFLKGQANIKISQNPYDRTRKAVDLSLDDLLTADGSMPEKARYFYTDTSDGAKALVLEAEYESYANQYAILVVDGELMNAYYTYTNMVDLGKTYGSVGEGLITDTGGHGAADYSFKVEKILSDGEIKTLIEGGTYYSNYALYELGYINDLSENASWFGFSKIDVIKSGTEKYFELDASDGIDQDKLADLLSFAEKKGFVRVEDIWTAYDTVYEAYGMDYTASGHMPDWKDID